MRSLVRLAVFFTIACIGGCATRSVVIENQTASHVHVEVAIGPVRKFFGSNQDYRFRLEEGERWDSFNAEREHQVEWDAAGGAHTGILIRTGEMDIDGSIIYSLSRFNRGHFIIHGKWPSLGLTGVNEEGDDIDIELASPDGDR